MKKLQKILSITFFGLLVFTFFLLLIGDLINIGTIIDRFSYFQYNWSIIFSWFIELGLSISIFVLSLLKLIHLLSNKEDGNPKESVKNGCLYFAIYVAACIVSEILVIINASSFGSINNLASLIVIIVFQAISCITLFLSTSKFENDLVNKVLCGIGYGTLFVSLIINAAYGAPTGLALAFTIFMFITTIVGIANFIICSFDFENKTVQEDNQSINNDSEISEKSMTENSESSVDQRLANLKNLHEQGLISDEEYNEKRKQIIDSL